MKVISGFIAFALLCAGTTSYGHAVLKGGKESRTYVSRYENVLGTSMELKITSYSQADAAEAEDAVLTEINRLAKVLSTYDPASEVSLWMKTTGRPVKVSRELFEVLQLFDTWRDRTHGALDASAEVVTGVWKDAARKNLLPAQIDLDEAVSKVRQTHWVLDATTSTAIHVDQVPLVLNSFVKSYIISHAAGAAMKRADIKAIVLNIGGDLVISGDIEEPVMVSDPKADAENETPLDALLIKGKAVATSGNYRRGELIGGHWYSHIVDPRTGMPADSIISATVIADDATDAGALATAFNVMTVDESRKIASAMAGIEYMIITRNGKRFNSDGWKRLQKTDPHKKNEPLAGPVNRGVGNALPDDYEMIINLEINVQKEGFSKRPYVAVWIEDTAHAPVRTVSVWHGSDRYMPELKSWFLKYRNNYNSDPGFKNSVTSATRSPGKYSLKWDGKDDLGKDVKPGKYIVKIEVSREHGTYQLMRQEIVCDGTAKRLDLPGNIEISAASLDYRKKDNGH